MDDDAATRGEPAESRAYARGYFPGADGSTEPDVLLDVPQLRVEEIILDVEDLRAHVSVEADVMNLLRLSVGADVQLGGVHLEIRGVEAQVLLKVHLDKIADIINRVLTTVDRNPEIVGRIALPLGAAAGELGRAAGGSVDKVTGDVATATSGLGRSVTETVQEIGESAAAPVEDTTAGPEVTEDESAAAAEGSSRGLLRRRKQARTAEEPPP